MMKKCIKTHLPRKYGKMIDFPQKFQVISFMYPYTFSIVLKLEQLVIRWLVLYFNHSLECLIYESRIFVLVTDWKTAFCVPYHISCLEFSLFGLIAINHHCIHVHALDSGSTSMSSYIIRYSLCLGINFFQQF